MMNRMEKLREFLEKNPQDDFVQHALALEYIKFGKEGEAGKLFKEILDRNPGYIGSYYHYAKLLERSGERDAASHWYALGMAAAKKAGDMHTYNELLAALDELSD